MVQTGSMFFSQNVKKCADFDMWGMVGCKYLKYQVLWLFVLWEWVGTDKSETQTKNVVKRTFCLSVYTCMSYTENVLLEMGMVILFEKLWPESSQTHQTTEIF